MAGGSSKKGGTSDGETGRGIKKIEKSKQKVTFVEKPDQKDKCDFLFCDIHWIL